MDFKKRIFEHLNDDAFNVIALDIFHLQYDKNKIYRQYVDTLKIVPESITHYSQVPFLPVSFFRTHSVVSGISLPEKIFLSSGTTGSERSRHIICDLSLYNESLLKGFESFYGPVK